jgi:N-acetylglutamate synthase-like GNAT family acetyltransferase
MYVRDAKNRDEVWLLDHVESLGLDDPAFRSRDYVVALDERAGDKAGFGRYRVRSTPDGDEVCEIDVVGTLPSWRVQGVGAHVVERLVEKARDLGFDEMYALTDEAGYCVQFGFETVPAEELPEPLQERLATIRESRDAVPLRLTTAEFEMPPRLRERFKAAAGDADAGEEPEETPEDFGIDPDSATYKYDTGRR